jgi:hypothetical protein
MSFVVCKGNLLAVVMQAGRRIYNPVEYTRLYCLSADQLTCHVVVVQANLQTFVLQQYLTNNRYLHTHKGSSFVDPVFYPQTWQLSLVVFVLGLSGLKLYLALTLRSCH